MFTVQKLRAGAPFPDLTVSQLGGGTLALGRPQAPHDWCMVVVYRGKHCPLCVRYLKELNAVLPKFHEIGVHVMAVSADGADKTEALAQDVQPTYPVGYDLSLPQMQALHLYVSEPHSPQETDRAFAEPALFVVNGDGAAQIIDISNTPVCRPELEIVAAGLAYMRAPGRAYPIRGTLA